MQKASSKLLVTIAILGGTIGSQVASASALSLSGYVNVDSSCTATITVSGYGNPINVPAGTDVNITLSNYHPVVPVNISGAGGTFQLTPGGKVTDTNNIHTFILGQVSSAAYITATPVPVNYSDPSHENPCPLGTNPGSVGLQFIPVTSPPTSNTVAPKTGTTRSTTQSTPTPANTTPVATDAPAAQTNTNGAQHVIKKQAGKPISAMPAGHRTARLIGGTLLVIVAIIVAASYVGWLPYERAAKVAQRQLKKIKL